MKNMQKIGSIGAFILASAYVVGVGLALTLLNTQSLTDPVERIAFHVENAWLFYIWITLIYIVAGVFLIPLALGVKERIKSFSQGPNPLADIGAFFGIAWAILIMGSGLVHNTGLMELGDIYRTDPEKAVEFWRIIETVHMGIGAEAEIPGGVWSILVGLAAWKTGSFPKWLNVLALVAGTAGILTIVPPLMDSVVAVYALAQVVWWVGMGITMSRKPIPVVS